MEQWFGAAMATRAWGGRVKTKSGRRQRLSLRREDGHRGQRARQPAIGAEWRRSKVNQQRPIVSNALVAAFELKRFLVTELGPGATSLGTTGVERAWWQHHVQNTSRTAVWATNAARQYRAVVSWKAEVRAAVRRQAEMVGHGGGSGQQAQALAELCETLSDHFVGPPRPPLLLVSSTPEEPSDEDLNVGLGRFWARLRDGGVDLIA